MATLTTVLPETLLPRPAFAPVPRRETVVRQRPGVEAIPASVPVPGIGRDIRVELARGYDDWKQAYALVASNYISRGYEQDTGKPVRFTPYLALPDTTTFVAKHGDTVVATLSLVMDNSYLGLPMECIYGEELNQLRAEGRNLVEVTSLADHDLSLREFVPTFVTLMRLSTQYGLRQGGDTWVITINPRHRTFYRKMMGFVPLGPWRAHPSVQNHPAEAYKLDVPQIRTAAPDMARQLLDEPLPAEFFRATTMPAECVRRLAAQSNHIDPEKAEEILRFVGLYGSPRRW